MHDGKITLQSKLGEGSEFIISLPVRTITEEKDSPQQYLMENLKNELNQNIQLEFSDILSE